MNNITKLNNAAGFLCCPLYVCGLVIKKEDLAKLSGVNDSKKLTEKNEQDYSLKL